LEEPWLRDPMCVAADVKNGYISKSRARDVYGVVLTHDGGTDLKGTERLRQMINRDADKL
jgi:N-methylhydantoinase B/oxoprolinase/acetone carboxylase alpha subunit